MNDRQLQRATDRAIAEVNAAYDPQVDDPEIERDVVRWRAWADAEAVVGPHGVVLPVALAKTLRARLADGVEGFITDKTLVGMLTNHIEKAGTR